MKKIFAIIMTICLLVSALSATAITAFAADEPLAGTVLRVSALKGEDTEVIGDFDSFEDGWNHAMGIAGDSKQMKAYDRVVVDIYADWTAVNAKFGSGDGFDNDTIYIPDDAKVTLNLNGHTIDRDMEFLRSNGEVMFIDEDADVIINNGTIKGGFSNNGAGGIHIDEANVTLNDVHIDGNKVYADDGAGIALYSGATLTMRGGSFKNNEAKGDIDCYGIAVYVNSSTASFKNVEFKNNQGFDDHHLGAAIYADDSEVTVDECVFDGNGIEDEAKAYLASVSVIHAIDSSITVTKSSFTNNGDLYYEGNYAKNFNNISTLIHLNDSTLVMEGGSNVTKNNTGHLIQSKIDSTFFITDTTFTDNRSIVLYSTKHASDSYFNNCTFDKNGFTYSGSKYTFASHTFMSQSSVTLYDCSMGNSTYTKPELFKFVNQELEGGIVLTLSALKTNGTVVKLEEYRSFEEGWSAAMALSNDDYWMRIENFYTAIVVDMHTDWVAKNGRFTSAFLNGIGFASDALCIPEGASVILNMNGYTINRGLEDTQSNGEVLSILSGAEVVINDGEITGGHSNNGAGGIHIHSGANVTLNNVSVSGNIVENDDGAAIAVYDGATLTMNGGSLENNLIFNTEFFFGHSYGAIYLNDASAVLTNVKISHNRLDGYHTSRGVAIYIDDSNLVMKNCTFTDNVHEENIGANSIICINGDMSTLDITGCKFENNGTPGYISAILFDIEGGNLKMKDSLCINNASMSIIHCDDGFVEVANTKFEGNVARVFYGTANGESKFDSCTFDNNSSEDGYYVFYFEEGNQLEFTNCEFGSSTFNDRSLATFDGEAGVGSIFGEGSLTMIVALVALVAAVASLAINLSEKMKKNGSHVGSGEETYEEESCDEEDFVENTSESDETIEEEEVPVENTSESDETIEEEEAPKADEE